MFGVSLVARKGRVRRTGRKVPCCLLYWDSPVSGKPGKVRVVKILFSNFVSYFSKFETILLLSRFTSTFSKIYHKLSVLVKFYIQRFSKNWYSFSQDGLVTPSIGIPTKCTYSAVHYLSKKHSRSLYNRRIFGNRAVWGYLIGTFLCKIHVFLAIFQNKITTILTFSTSKGGECVR